MLYGVTSFKNSNFFKQAKAKRRFVLGLREVSKHLKLRKLKCVIISSNVERIKSAGKLKRKYYLDHSSKILKRISAKVRWPVSADTLNTTWKIQLH